MTVKLVGSSRMSSSNQITLPKEAREALNIKPGVVVAIYLEINGEKQIIIKKG